MSKGFCSGFLRKTSFHLGPARNPGGDSRRSGRGRGRLGPVSRKQAQELLRLGAEPAANLNADHDEAAPPGAFELISLTYGALQQ